MFLARVGEGPWVVLKRLHAHVAHNWAVRAALLEEARVAARLRHPNIAQLLEVGEAEGETFLAMEYVAGRSLAEVMAEGPVGVAESVRLVRQVTSALAALHGARGGAGQALNLVHGDVTPRNVLLDERGDAKLIDFGSAQTLRRDSESGTLEYLAPERLDDGDVDSRSDQFSLGVVWWELLTGRALFHGESDAHTIDLLESLEVVPPSRHAPQVPDDVDAVVLKMLSRDPAARFSSHDEVLLALDELGLDAGGAAPPRAVVVAPPGPPRPTPGAHPPPPTDAERQAWLALQGDARALVTALARLDRLATLEELEALSPDAIDLLEALCHAGLVDVVDQASGERRYRAHPAVRGLLPAA